MGFLFRAAVVIGTVYAISPLRDAQEPLVPRAAQESLARGAQDAVRQAAGAAVDLCRSHAATCMEAAALVGPKASQPVPVQAAPPAASLGPAPMPPRRPEKPRAAP